jgi:hypothetical protein
MGDRADSDGVLQDHQAGSGRLAVTSTRQGSGLRDAVVWALLDGLRLGVTVSRSPAFVLL